MDLSSGNILITGSGGFIGSHVVEQLNYLGHDNLVHVDMLIEQSNKEFWDQLPDPKYAMCVSAFRKDLLEHHNITKVIHLAARSHVDNSISDPVSFTFDNALATHELLESCRQYGKIEKFVLISTDETLGSLGFDDYPFDERSPINPSSPYSASKAAQELIAQSYFKTYGFPVVITRCSNNYGPRQHPEKFIPKTIKSLLNKEKVKIYGDGENIRDWIDVRCHVGGIIDALRLGEPGEVYSFGGDNEISNWDLFISIHNCLEIEGENILPFEESYEFVKDRLGHDLRYAISNYKAMRELGFKLKYSRMYETFKWYLDNREWLDAR